MVHQQRMVAEGCCRQHWHIHSSTYPLVVATACGRPQPCWVGQKRRGSVGATGTAGKTSLARRGKLSQGAGPLAAPVLAP